MTDNTEKAISDNAPAAIQLTDAEKAKALKDGAKEDAKKTGEAAHHALTDGVQVGENAGRKFYGYDEIQLYAHLLDGGIEVLEDAIDKKDGIPEEKVYGLLALERNGKNRTPFVKLLMKRLNLKADELPGGGPDYTNDVTNITKL